MIRHMHECVYLCILFFSNWLFANEYWFVFNLCVITYDINVSNNFYFVHRIKNVLMYTMSLHEVNELFTDGVPLGYQRLFVESQLETRQLAIGTSTWENFILQKSQLVQTVFSIEFSLYIFIIMAMNHFFRL